MAKPRASRSHITKGAYAEASSHGEATCPPEAHSIQPRMMLLCISCIPLLPCTKPSNRSPIVDQIPDKPSSVPTPTVELVTDEPVQGVTLANIDNLLLLPNQLAWPKSQVLHGPFRCRCYNEKREGKSLRFFSLTKPEATLSN